MSKLTHKQILETESWAEVCAWSKGPTRLTPSDIETLHAAALVFGYDIGGTGPCCPNGVHQSAINLARALVEKRRNEYVPPKPWAKIARQGVENRLGPEAPKEVVEALVTLILWGKLLKDRSDFGAVELDFARPGASALSSLTHGARSWDYGTTKRTESDSPKISFEGQNPATR